MHIFLHQEVKGVLNVGQQIGIMYLCVYEKLEKRMKSRGLNGDDKTYPKKEFFVMLGELFRVPKELRKDVLKEMKKMDLIEVNGKEIKLITNKQTEELKPYFL